MTKVSVFFAKASFGREVYHQVHAINIGEGFVQLTQQVSADPGVTREILIPRKRIVKIVEEDEPNDAE